MKERKRVLAYILAVEECVQTNTAPHKNNKNLLYIIHVPSLYTTYILEYDRKLYMLVI
jgi:hypothetical protein